MRLVEKRGELVGQEPKRLYPYLLEAKVARLMFSKVSKGLAKGLIFWPNSTLKT